MEKMGMYSSEVANACRLCAEHIFDDRAEPPMWPVNIVSSLWYISKYFPRRLYAFLTKLRLQGVTPQRISELFRGTGRIAYVFHQTEFPIDGLGIDEADDLFRTLMNCMSYYRKEDIYCKKMRNILWTQDEATHYARMLDLRSLPDESDALRSLFGKANASLWLYTEFINAAKHPYSHEFHGPYSIGNNELLIARHYYDLRPTEVWPCTAELPFESVRTIEIYKGLEWGFSFFNHSQSSSTAPGHLRRFGVAIDDQAVYTADEEVLHWILQSCSKVIASANEQVLGFKEVDWHRKLMELHHYYLKPFADEIGVDWHPKRALYDFIRETPKDSTYDELLTFIGDLFGTKSREEGVELLTDRFVSNIYKTRTRFSEVPGLEMEA